MESVACIFAPSMFPFSMADLTCARVEEGGGGEGVGARENEFLPSRLAFSRDGTPNNFFNAIFRDDEGKHYERATPHADLSGARATHLGLQLFLLFLALGGRPRKLLGGELQVEDLVQQLVFFALTEQVEHRSLCFLFPT